MVPDRLCSVPAGDFGAVEAMMWWQGWQNADQINARHRVVCPCCRGKKHIKVTRHDAKTSRTVLELALCLQCEGTGELEDISGG